MQSYWLTVALLALPIATAVFHADRVRGAEEKLLAPALEWWDQWRAKTKEPIPDFDALKSSADLPPLLRFADGRTVRTPADWQARKAEIRRLLCHYIIGAFPDHVPPMTHAEIVQEEKLQHARRRLMKLTYHTATPTVENVSLTVELLIPEGKGPFPVFMTQVTHRRVGLIGLSRGYLVCIYPGGDTDDQSDRFSKAYPAADWGRLARRAWLGSRVLDYLLTLSEADKEHVAITGHSRNGKQSLIAAAFDERITAIVSSSSGTGGSVGFRFVGENAFEESVEFMSRQSATADWFHPRIRFFTGREDKLPIDTHGYLALIAPRPCLISSAYNDGVDTTFATERNYIAAREVYRFLGKPEALRIRWRPGSHEWNAEDAQAYFDWFDMAAGRSAAGQSADADRRTTEFPEQLLHTFDWQTWKSQQQPASLKPPQSASSPAAAIRWSLGDEPPLVSDPGGTSDVEPPHDALLMSRDSRRTPDIRHLSLNFGNYIPGDLYCKKDARQPMPVIIWLHPYSYSLGYSGAYVLGTRTHIALANRGYAVFAFDQIGFGRRLLEGRDFYTRYPHWSKLGKMVADVRSAVDMLTESVGRSPAGDALALPALDHKRIYCLGYSLGGTVALYAAALDDRIAGVASFCGFTPLRTDTDAKPTGGIRRLWELHGLQPRLGMYDGRESELPYDFEDVLALVAPAAVPDRRARPRPRCRPGRRQSLRRKSAASVAISGRRQAIDLRHAQRLQPFSSRPAGDLREVAPGGDGR
jgi:pimeloyl-ACP methyl ester carboxylesterase